jgi:hypothetical protein
MLALSREVVMTPFLLIFILLGVSAQADAQPGCPITPAELLAAAKSGTSAANLMAQVRARGVQGPESAFPDNMGSQLFNLLKSPDLNKLVFASIKDQPCKTVPPPPPPPPAQAACPLTGQELLALARTGISPAVLITRVKSVGVQGPESALPPNLGRELFSLTSNGDLNRAVFQNLRNQPCRKALPRVETFASTSLEVKVNEPVILSWTCENSRGAELNGEGVPAIGAKTIPQVNPPDSTFRLICLASEASLANSEASTLKIKVNAPPVSPLSLRQVLLLLEAGVDEERLIAEITRRKVDFRPAQEALQQLQKAGAKGTLIATLMGNQK